MNTEADFLAALAASPDDALLVSAFADFLEERGDARARYVRDDAVRPWMGGDFRDPLPAILDAVRKSKKRAAVRKAVARLGPVVVPALSALLADPSHAVRAAARDALDAAGALGDIAAKAARDLRGRSAARRLAALDLLGELCRADGNAAPLVAALRHADAAVRAAAARHLNVFTGPAVPAAVAALRAALADADAAVRVAAARALYAYQLSATSTIPHLVNLLSDPVADVRHAATFALPALDAGLAESLPALLRTLDDPEPGVAVGAVQALDRLRELPAEAGPVLLRFLARCAAPGEQTLAPEHAFGLLSRVRPTSDEIVAAFAAALGDPARPRSFVLNELARIGPGAAAALPALFDMLLRWDYPAIQIPRAILAVGGPSVVPALLDHVRTGTASVALATMIEPNTPDDAAFVEAFIDRMFATADADERGHLFRAVGRLGATGQAAAKMLDLAAAEGSAFGQAVLHHVTTVTRDLEPLRGRILAAYRATPPGSPLRGPLHGHLVALRATDEIAAELRDGAARPAPVTQADSDRHGDLCCLLDLLYSERPFRESFTREFLGLSRSPDSTVRLRATRLLADLCADDLAGDLCRLADDADEHVRRAAVEGLGRSRDESPARFAAIAAAIDGRDGEERRIAVVAANTARRATPEIVAALRRAAGDGNRRIAAAARRALKALGVAT